MKVLCIILSFLIGFSLICLMIWIYNKENNDND